MKRFVPSTWYDGTKCVFLQNPFTFTDTRINLGCQEVLREILSKQRAHLRKLHSMSRPPGLDIPQEKQTSLNNDVFQAVSESLAWMEQYLQSGETKDEDCKYEYRDANGLIQGPFTSKEMEEWQKAGYLAKKLRVRKRSVIAALMDGGAFIEMDKLGEGREAFHSENNNKKMRETLESLDKLVVLLEGTEKGIVEQSPWTKKVDPNSGSPYWYNETSGVSQWQKP